MATIEETFISDCKRSKNEEEIRIATNILLRSVSEQLGISRHVDNERTYMAGGRADSIYQQLIFEFKKPGHLRTERGRNEAIHGRDERDRGLFHYLVNQTLMAPEVSDDLSFLEHISSLVGVAFDGQQFLFTRFKPSIESTQLSHPSKTAWNKPAIKTEQPVELEVTFSRSVEHGIRQLFLLLRSTTKTKLTSANLIESFSHESALTKQCIPYLFHLLETEKSKNMRINTLFLEWRRIFGEIFVGTETDFTKFSSSLKEMYGIEGRAGIEDLLFVLQTYYSMVIKLMVHLMLGVVSDPLAKTRPPRTKSELHALFSGTTASNLLVTNFFEIHFYEWFIMSEEFDVELIGLVIDELEAYEATTAVIKPEAVRDVLKGLYQSLVPRDLRHLMGEYYTPDWLVDFVLDEAQFDPATSRAVDPTCGSGTFLVHMINRIRTFFRDQPDSDLISIVVERIVGFDINPIAVITSKANFLIALGDISQAQGDFAIPVYMCDSILVPTVHAKQASNEHKIEIETVVGKFEIPVFETREQSDHFLQLLSKCVLNGYQTFSEFVSIYQRESNSRLSEIQMIVGGELFEKLHSLHLSGRNGFWPIILKNSFAPLFLSHKFDVVVGNPPWISWKAMSASYRKMTLDIWLSYGIFEKNAYDKITSHDDFAMAVTYVSIDHYLKDGGITAFILPQSFVKSSKGGEGFRKFKITRDELDIPFAVERLFDFVAVDPFRGEASNNCSVYVFRKGVPMSYPFSDYFVSKRISGQPGVRYEDSLDQAQQKFVFEQLTAIPINENQRSPWMTGLPANIESMKKILGPSPYKARKGIEPCGAKGVYLVELVDRGNGKVGIRNLLERSRLKAVKDIGVHEGIVETDLIFPMLGGRNFERWGVKSNLHMLVPHAQSGEGIYRGLPESDLRTKFPNTDLWLRHFHDVLLETRVRSGKFFVKDKYPFYRLDNVGDYTFAPWKVLWKEQSKSMASVVVSTIDDPLLGSKEVVVDSKVLFVPLESEAEAHYLCAMLNSEFVSEVVDAYTISVQKGVDIVKNIQIPKFDKSNTLHVQVAELSRSCHKAYVQSDGEELAINEIQITEASKAIFGL